MSRSTTPLKRVLRDLTAEARRQGLSDAEWARRALVPKETLCRLRARTNCDFQTLVSLATAISVRIGPLSARDSDDGWWPASVDRAYEARLLDLMASGSTDADAWRHHGPAFFMAGLAVMLASLPGMDRPAYLALAETLHSGASETSVFQSWLAGTPLSPSRILPALEHARRAA